MGGALLLALRTLYCHHNGLNLFADALSLHGQRHRYERAGDGARQPYDLVDLNRYRYGGPTPGRLYLDGNAEVGWVSIDLHTHAV